MHRSATALQVLCYSVVLWNLWQGAYKIVCRFFWGKKKGVYLQPVTLEYGRGLCPAVFCRELRVQRWMFFVWFRELDLTDFSKKVGQGIVGIKKRCTFATPNTTPGRVTCYGMF